MKYIIDLPDKVYGLLKYFETAMGFADKKEDANDDVKTVLIRAVINGTPLKGHGRLIDADALMRDYGNPDVEILLDNMDTIIEADKEQEDESEK